MAIATIMFISLILGFLFATNVYASYTPTPQQLIYEFAQEFNASEEELLAVAKCESNFFTEAQGRAGEIGIFQYLPSTFEWFSQIKGERLDINSYYDQIKLTAFMYGLENVGDKWKGHWTCYRNLKNRKSV